MLVVAYLVSAALEVAGIAFVVFDVRSDRRKARKIMEELPEQVYGGSQTRHPGREAAIVRHGGDDAVKHLAQRLQAEERQTRAMRRNYEQADAHLRETLRDLLHGNIVQRLRGPVLVALGVVVGTAANIAAM